MKAHTTILLIAWIWMLVPLDSSAGLGDLDLTFNPDSVDNAVLTLAPQSDGRILIGGAFASIGGEPRAGIARLNSDGSLDDSFLQGFAGANSYVWSVALEGDGKVLLGGFFTSVNSVERRSVARLNSNGTLDSSFLNGQAGANGSVYSIIIQEDGKILLAGDFTSFNGVSRHYLARLNNDGSVDGTFLNGLTGADTASFSLALQDDGKILTGGWFTSINGTARNHLARLNANGSLDNSFLNGLEGPNGRVWSIAIQADGKILIGGDFTQVNGVTRQHLARLNTDGSLDSSFLGGFDTINDSVWSIAVQGDARILIGGTFSSVLGVPRSSIARLNPDGGIDLTFLNNLAGANGTVRSIVLQQNGSVLIAGQFTAVNLSSRTYVARLLGNYGAPQLGNARMVNGQFAFTMSGEPGKIVILQSSTNLQHWLPVATNTLTTVPITFTEPQGSGSDQRFFRLFAP